MSRGFANSRSALFAGLKGDPIFFDTETDSVPGSYVDLINATVPASEVYNLQQVYAHAPIGGEYRVLIGASVVGSGNTGPGERNFYFSWFPSRSVAEAETVKVQFRQRGTASNAVKVKAHLQLTKQSI